jgi:hypothetical protein
MKKISSFILFLAVLLAAQPAKAICPVCTIAVGAGVGILHHYGVDDTITGIWLGGLTVSLSLWTLSWFKHRKIDFYFKEFITFASYYIFTLGTLWWLKYLWHPLNKLWGMDKLIIGMFIGTVFFFLSALSYFRLKKANGGHPNFPFQKVVMTVGSMIILTVVFYFITKK